MCDLQVITPPLSKCTALRQALSFSSNSPDRGHMDGTGANDGATSSLDQGVSVQSCL